MTTSTSKTTAGPETAKPVPTRVGVVESDKRDKTRKVVVAFQQQHAKYGKYLSKRTVLHVHDANNESRVGDRVEVRPCRPISRTKRWELVKVVERAPAV